MGYVSVNELDDAIESSDRDSQLFRSANGPWRLDCLHVLSIESGPRSKLTSWILAKLLKAPQSHTFLPHPHPHPHLNIFYKSPQYNPHSHRFLTPPIPFQPQVSASHLPSHRESSQHVMIVVRRDITCDVA